MLKDKRFISAMIIFLLLINIWQWWSESNVLQASEDEGQMNNESALILAGYAAGNLNIDKVRRDLFSVPMPNSIKTIDTKQKQKQKQEKPKKVKKLKNTVSNSEQFKLVGVLFKNGKKNAYLTKGEDDYVVNKGELIEGRYRVKGITVSTITLLESRTQRSTTIYMHQ